MVGSMFKAIHASVEFMGSITDPTAAGSHPTVYWDSVAGTSFAANAQGCAFGIALWGARPSRASVLASRQNTLEVRESETLSPTPETGVLPGTGYRFGPRVISRTATESRPYLKTN